MSVSAERVWFRPQFGWDRALHGEECAKCGATERFAEGGYKGKCVRCHQRLHREARERSRRRHQREAEERARRQSEENVPEDWEARRMRREKRKDARRRGLAFALPVEWFTERLGSGVCEESGIPFYFLDTEGSRSAFAPSVDRIDSSKGYTPGNCRMVLWALNSAFGEWGAETAEEIMAVFLEKRGWGVTRPERKQSGGSA